VIGFVVGWYLLLFCFYDTGFASNTSYVTVYGAVLTRDSLGRTTNLSADFSRGYTLLAVALGRHLTSIFNPNLKLGIEGQLVRHFGGHPHGEANGLMLVRWTRFPWHRSINTTFAAGAGVSYANEVPELEQIELRKSDLLLGYLLFELTLGLPSHPQWSLSTRIHHRSGADGHFSDGVYGASNALGLGVSYSF
jgi:hypothetical protein